MSQTTFVEFRGEWFEVEYTLGRYEYDTGAQEFEWWFLDKTVRPTPGEHELLDASLYARAVAAQWDDYHD